ncbi:MAG: sugar-transfer associated ATP-grasp domain-containing protein, partial [Pseudomonadota bacterium]
MIKRFGTHVAANEGIAIEDQREAVLALSRRFCIRPHDVYRFRLYRDADSALDYIFPRESMPLHRMQNSYSDGVDHGAVQDKLEFARRAVAANLPSVPTLRHFAKRENVNLSDVPIGDSEGVFIKSRTGFRGMGAFSIQTQDGNFVGRMLETGRRLDSETDINSAITDLLRDDDALVQPLLANHAALSKASAANQAIIIRVITVQSKQRPKVYSAYMRVPAVVKGLSNTSSNIEMLAGVDLVSGRILRNANSLLNLNPHLSLLEANVFEMIGEDTVVPFWDEILETSLAAQREFSGLWGIGWDWIVSQDKPYLLEGNVYWGMQKPQEVSGGMAAALIDRFDLFRTSQNMRAMEKLVD